MAESVDEIIDTLGFGKFSVILILVVGVFYMGDASELNLVSIISPELRCLWNLSSLQTSVLSSMVFLGMSIGNIYWGYLSDKHGRKKFLIIGAFLVVYFGMMSCISDSFTWILISRFFVGVGLGAAAFVNNYISEYVNIKHRGKSVLFVSLFYALGSIYVAVIALLLMRSAGWRVFLFVATIPPSMFLLVSAWLPESVRYLQNTGNYDEIIAILNRVSSLNNVPIHHMNVKCTVAPEKGNIAILWSKDYRWKMTIMIILSITVMAGYYGLVLLNTELLQSQYGCHQLTIINTTVQCHELNDKDYYQNILVVLSELPGILMPLILVDLIGRKYYMIPGLLISALGFLCLNLCLSKQFVTILMFILRLLLSGLSQMMFVLNAELFPTVIRATSMGICLMVGRLCMIGVPFLVQSLLYISLMGTSAIFSGLCLLSALLLLFLPETKDSSLKNT